MRYKRILIIVGMFVGIVLGAYLIMLIDTNPVVNEVKNVMSGQISKELTQDTPLSMYNTADWNPTSVNISIRRVFVWHNFRDGYMRVIYTYKAFDSSGTGLTGSSRVLSKWTIHKENGKWVITDIEEAP